MTDHPDEPAGPSRIILPGGGKPGGLVGPDGRPITSGADEEAGGGLPTHPRLRPLEFREVVEGGVPLLVISDPSGIAPEPIAVSGEAMPVLMLLDGSVALDDLVALVDREVGDPRAGDSVRRLVEALDRGLYLESPRYFAARDAALAEYRAQEARPAALAGLSYPEEPAALQRFLGEQDAAARAWRDGAAVAPGLDAPAPAPAGPAAAAPRALAAPHIDPRRGGALIARSYLELDGLAPDDLPDVFFVFGVGHTLLEQPYALTSRPFDTPLGRVDTDADVVRWIEEQCGPGVVEEELAHAGEHSIEFQVVALRHRLPGRAFRVVPILCGGFHGLVRAARRPADVPAIESLVAATAAAAGRLERDGQRVACVAGIDLSHVGARFGDALDLDAETLGAVEQHDRAALAAALAGDAEGWFDAIAAHGDSTRICGFAAMYTMLRVARPGHGRLLAYEQSLEEGGSVVTYAAAAWP